MFLLHHLLLHFHHFYLLITSQLFDFYCSIALNFRLFKIGFSRPFRSDSAIFSNMTPCAFRCLVRPRTAPLEENIRTLVVAVVHSRRVYYECINQLRFLVKRARDQILPYSYILMFKIPNSISSTIFICSRVINRMSIPLLITSDANLHGTEIKLPNQHSRRRLMQANFTTSLAKFQNNWPFRTTKNAKNSIDDAEAKTALTDDVKQRAQSRNERDVLKKGKTNETIRIVNGMRHKRLGQTDIVVSEIGLGTQRWGSADFNAPNEGLCHEFLDYAVLENGVSLIDTAEQYPIPSDRNHPEGYTEAIIGNWIAKDRARRREKVVIATKITGGSNVNKKNIRKDLEQSLLRLKTDYVDIYTMHWPSRYTPQSNWGQSLQYNVENESAPYYRNAASFEEIAEAMGELIKEGKLRGWGSCNDNAYGLTAMCYAARSVNAPEPCCLQGDFSLINRRMLENGVAEASSPVHENVGWMAYNVLAGGVLTGKYIEKKAAPDLESEKAMMAQIRNPRGRMDDYSWGSTLYRYRSDPALRAVKLYSEIATKNQMSLTELSCRWAKDCKANTTSLIGHTSIDQLKQTVKYFNESVPKLDDSILWDIDRVHMLNRLPIFASERVSSDMNGRGEIGESIP